MTSAPPSRSAAPATLGDLIALGEAQFLAADLHYGQGTTNAWDESRWLTLAALHLPVDSPIEIESQPVSDQDQQAVQAYFDRRIGTRLPAAYITGIAWLKGYAFAVDPRVIVPRSFIAELLLEQMAPWVRDPNTVTRVLDLCTGSGCLAIMAADQFPHAHVTATDISPEALAVANDNVAAYALQDRVQLVHSDVFTALHDLPPFDLILSNPPYVPQSKRETLPAEFRNEPELALMAADSGMAIVRKILAQASAHLTPQGILVVEVGHERAACETLLESEFSGLAPIWIQTDEQSDNVFLVNKSELDQHPWRPTP